MSSQDNWTTIIKPSAGLFQINLKELYKYSDLLWLFVKRDIVVVHKQTILGPLWYIIQPILTTIMYAFIFGKVAKLSTDGIPHLVFYMSGVTLWNYFSECLDKTSNTFLTNQHLFGKVYFPRAIVPMSIIFSGMIKFFIQFGVFLTLWGYYFYEGSLVPQFQYLPILFLVLFNLGTISLGFGMFFSSLTTKYRDLTFLLKFGVQLWMYATPVIYSLSSIPTHYQEIIRLNPITALIEVVRATFLGKGLVSPADLVYSTLFGLGILLMGLLIFSKVERKFMDTV